MTASKLVLRRGPLTVYREPARWVVFWRGRRVTQRSCARTAQVLHRECVMTASHTRRACDNGGTCFCIEHPEEVARINAPAPSAAQDRLDRALACLREGTEVLRTGGGTALTAAQCNLLLDEIERLRGLFTVVANGTLMWHPRTNPERTAYREVRNAIGDEVARVR